MAATALLQFVQGANIGLPGQVLVGVTGTLVSVQNTNNVGVASWQIDLVYTPPGSAVPVAVPLAFNNNSNTPGASITPGVPGSFRFVLKVWDVINRVGNPTDIDIRNFCIREPIRGFILPPYQKDPDPLPTLASGAPGAKPNEMNINGSELGWEGDGATDGLFAQIVKQTSLNLTPDLSTSNPTEVLAADALNPFLNYPTATVFDGTHVWVLGANAGIFLTSNTNNVTGWYIAKIDPVTNKYLEVIRTGTGRVDPTDPGTFNNVDIGGRLIWTGTQLFVYGVNPLLAQAFVQEVIRGPGHPSFGPRLVLSVTDLMIGVTWDGAKIWTCGQTGNVYRFDPTTPDVPELTLFVSGSTLADIIYDPDGSPYPDTQPRIYTCDATNIYRIKDISTLAPSVDATVGTATTKMALGAGFLFGGSSGTISRFIREPLALDISTGGPNFPLGVVYDPGTGKGFIAAIDNATSNPILIRITTGLVFEVTTTLDVESFSAIPFFPFDMVVVPTTSSVFVPEEGFSRAGAGNVYSVNTTSMVSTRTTRDLALHYSDRYGQIQYVVFPTDPTNPIWNGIADTIAVALPVAAPVTVTVPFGPPTAKKVTIIDAFGLADPTNSITVQGLGPGTIVGDLTPITTAFGFIELSAIGIGKWAVSARTTAGPTTVPLSLVRYVDQNTSVVIGNDGSIDRPFATLTAALNSGARHLRVVPGDYSAEGSLPTLNVTGSSGSITNMGHTGGNFTSGMVTISVLTVAGSASDDVSLVGVECSNISSAVTTHAIDCDLFASGTVGEYRCRGGRFTGFYHSLIADNCTINNAAGPLTDGLGAPSNGVGTLLRGCAFNSTGLLASNINNTIRMQDTEFPLGALQVSFVNPGGGLWLDGFTNYLWQQATIVFGTTLTNGVVSLINQGTAFYDILPPLVGLGTNDYNPTGFATATNIYQANTGSANITGFAAPSVGIRIDYNFRKTFINTGPGVIVFNHENVGSSAVNRLTIPGALDLYLQVGEEVTFSYDLQSNRWRAMIVTLPRIGSVSNVQTTSSPTTNLDTTSVLVLVDSSNGARTVNLPATPSPWQTVIIKDRDGNASVNNITIGNNGNAIDGNVGNVTLGTNNGSLTLGWTNGVSILQGWRII